MPSGQISIGGDCDWIYAPASSYSEPATWLSTHHLSSAWPASRPVRKGNRINRDPAVSSSNDSGNIVIALAKPVAHVVHTRNYN